MVSSSIFKAKRKNIRISRLACYAAILYPFLNYYGYGNLTFSFVMIFLLFIYVIKSRGHITFAYPIFIISYMAYLCIMRVLCNITSFSDMLAPSLIYIFILYGFFNKEIALPLFLRIYRWTVFVNILFFRKHLKEHFCHLFKPVSFKSFNLSCVAKCSELRIDWKSS